MCPVCLASAGMIAGNVVSAGGVTALVAKVWHGRKKAESNGLKIESERRREHGNGTVEERGGQGRVAQ
jgi:hypothetical protein